MPSENARMGGLKPLLLFLAGMATSFGRPKLRLYAQLSERWRVKLISVISKMLTVCDRLSSQVSYSVHERTFLATKTQTGKRHHPKQFYAKVSTCYKNITLFHFWTAFKAILFIFSWHCQELFLIFLPGFPAVTDRYCIIPARIVLTWNVMFYQRLCFQHIWSRVSSFLVYQMRLKNILLLALDLILAHF